MTAGAWRGALLAGLCAAAAGAAEPAPDGARGLLLGATRTLHDAAASGNPATLEALLDPAYQLVDSRGRVHGRDEVLAAARRHDVDLESTVSDLSDLRVTVVGTTGVVSGIAVDELHYAGRDERRRRRFTEVWVQAPAGWRLIASHESGADLTRISHAPLVRDRSP